MAFVSGALMLVSTLLLPPFAITLGISLILASLGISLGVRKLYVAILLKLFEYGRFKIEKAYLRKVSIDATAAEKLNGLFDNSVISREGVIFVPQPKIESEECADLSAGDVNTPFNLALIMDLIKTGVEVKLVSWNLLTRTNRNYQYVSMRLTILWGLGFFFRYLVLLPVRLFLLVFAVGLLCISTAIIGYIPDSKFKKWLNWSVSLMCFRILSRVFSAIVTYHDRENRASKAGICVANHTSPIDVVVLACDNCYALIGQSHGGFLGLLQRALNRASSHIWFERSETKDRYAVARRLREHVEDEKKLPILIFPEGTCINNTSVMMFKKGSFEIGATIYPVAIKYDPIFGDPFWNSSQQGYLQYLLMMMTSWAIVCDVWYLPPMVREEGEDAVEFANRVKAEIARRGGLVDLVWDGQLKRMKVKKEWKEQQQEVFSQRIKVD